MVASVARVLSVIVLNVVVVLLGKGSLAMNRT